MRITATRRLQYAIGHRILKHESKCRHLHGHNFVFFLTAEAFGHADSSGEPVLLDNLGRVIDFGVLKSKFDPWFSNYWDHGFVIFDEDHDARAAMLRISDQKFFELPYNPTAENLGRYILENLGPALLAGTGVRLVRVQIFETENGIAEVTLDGPPMTTTVTSDDVPF